MKFIFYIQTLFLALPIISCDSKSGTKGDADQNTNMPSLYINIKEAASDGQSNLKMHDSLSVVNTDDFEIQLVLIETKMYRAQKNLKQSHIGQPFFSTSIEIVDSTRKVVVFTSSTEFLNYMTERGYDVVDEVKSKYVIDYTFEKR